jgi:hypothetical protein
MIWGLGAELSAGAVGTQRSQDRTLVAARTMTINEAKASKPSDGPLGLEAAAQVPLLEGKGIRPLLPTL